MDYSTASAIAVEICYKLQPYTDKLNIAGSIRRRKPEVKDIEIVCLPKQFAKPATTLFGPPENGITPGFAEAVAKLGTVLKGKPDGKQMQIELPEGIKLDLFIPDAWDYYRQYAIRTGSADYSAKVIAGGWAALGWCGSDKGLRLKKDCQLRISGGKNVWICTNKKAVKPPVWESEEAFFAWLGVEWVKPQERNV